jgi:hypothetical protein
MTKKHFIFEHSTYWTDQGCDCCDPWEWDLYNCLSHELNGGSSSEEDCLLSVIEYLDYDKYLEVLNREDEGFDAYVEGYLKSIDVTWEFIEED